MKLILDPSFLSIIFFFASFLFFLPTKQIFCLLNGNVILLFSQATLLLCFLYSASTPESSPHLSHFYLLPVMFIFIRMLRGRLASSFFCFSSSVDQHWIFSVRTPVQHVPALSFLLIYFLLFCSIWAILLFIIILFLTT